MAHYKPADEEIVKIADRLVELYHPWLRSAKIGMLFGYDMPKRRGRVDLGNARRVPAHIRAYLDYDFIITINAEELDALTGHQIRALIDHELCHCSRNSKGDFALEDHDLTEFVCIIERYGLWWPSAYRMAKAIQPHLPVIEAWLSQNGEVKALSAQQADMAGGLEAEEEESVAADDGASRECNGADDNYSLEDDLSDILDRKERDDSSDESE